MNFDPTKPVRLSSKGPSSVCHFSFSFSYSCLLIDSRFFFFNRSTGSLLGLLHRFVTESNTYLQSIDLSKGRFGIKVACGIKFLLFRNEKGGLLASWREVSREAINRLTMRIPFIRLFNRTTRRLTCSGNSCRRHCVCRITSSATVGKLTAVARSTKEQRTFYDIATPSWRVISSRLTFCFFRSSFSTGP